MKINWGTSIVIAMVSFISFILFMVIIMISTHTDVVELDYYVQQIGYQETKEAKEEGLKIGSELVFKQTSKSFIILFPEQKILQLFTSGTAHFYRPENADLDKKVELNVKAGRIQKIPLNILEKGTYMLKLRWKDSLNDYLVEKQIIIE